MTPEATFQPFPTSTFSSSPTATPSTTLNTRNPLGYNFLLKDPRESFYGNPRYDLLSQPPNNLLYSYYSNFYPNNNLYSSTDILMNNSRRNIYGFNNNFPYLNNPINSYVLKDTFTNPFDNILCSTTTCPQALKANTLLSDELLSNTDISDTTDILSPVILSETKEDEKLIQKKEIKLPKSISSIKNENTNRNMKKVKKAKQESITTTIEQLSIQEDNKKIKSLPKKKSKKGKSDNGKKKICLTTNINHPSPVHQTILDTIEDENPLKKTFSYLSSESSSPLLAFTYSPSSMNTPSLYSPSPSTKSFSFEDLTSNVTTSEDNHSISNSSTTLDLGIDSYSTSTVNSISNTSSCSSPNSSLSPCSSSISSIINLTLNKKPKRKGGNSKGRKRPNHPHKVTRILKEWLTNNSYPYPSNTEKSRLCDATGLTMTQLNNWFINARRRYI